MKTITINIAETEAEQGEGVWPVGSMVGTYNHAILIPRDDAPEVVADFRYTGTTLVISALPGFVDIALAAIDAAQKQCQLRQFR